VAPPAALVGHYGAGSFELEQVKTSKDGLSQAALALVAS
jgi:hypothetical protein